RDDVLLGRVALTLLAVVAGEGVQRPRADAPLWVVEIRDELGDRRLLEMVVEHHAAADADDRLVVPEPAPDGGRRGGARIHEGLQRGLRLILQRKVLDEAVVLVHGRKRSQRFSATTKWTGRGSGLPSQLSRIHRRPFS